MGGAETLVKEYATKINLSKFDVTLLLLNRLDSPYEKIVSGRNINVIYVSDYLLKSKNFFTRKFNHFLRYFYVKKIIHSVSPDIIHTHIVTNTYIRFAKPKKRTKIFHTVHSEPQAYWGKGKWKKDYRAAKYLVKEYGMRFIALHDKMRLEINELFGVSDTIVLNNGIDFSRFENAKEKSIIRAEIAIPKNAFVLGHIGRFAEVKNHSFVVEIFKILSKKNANAFLLLVGDGVLKTAVEKQLKAEGLFDKCLILSHRTDIPDLLSAMDVFVFPSKYEGLGISLVEAQKMGLPCIVSDTVPKFAQISNLVEWHSLSESAEKWAISICNFSVEKIEWNGLENWDIDLIVKQLEVIYEQCSNKTLLND
mgnify:CR=1 FL=1